MTSIQVCPYCHEPFNADRHKFGGFCSALHRTLYEREHRLIMRPSNFMSDQHRERPAPNRKNGVDRKAQS